MSNQPAKKSPPMKRPNQSKKSSTPSDAEKRIAELEARAAEAEKRAEEAEKKAEESAVEAEDSKKEAKDALGLLDNAMGHLKTLTSFHEDVDSASHNDLRIWWDVRILRGKGESFAQTTGSSSLPNALSKKMMVNAQAVVQQEVVDKIARPLSTKMMEVQEQDLKLTEVEDMSQQDHRGRQRLMDREALTGDPILDIAAEVDAEKAHAAEGAQKQVDVPAAEQESVPAAESPQTEKEEGGES